MTEEKLGITRLRNAVRLFDACIEGFNLKYSEEDLLKIASAHAECDWDFYPDAWEERQVQDAIRHGIIPQFLNDGSACYSDASNLHHDAEWIKNNPR